MGNRVDQVAPSATLRPRVPRLHTFSSLRYRNFRYLWGSTLFASGGQWIQQITLSWLIYDMSHSAFLTGALLGARSLPFLVVAPIGGVLIDRFDRRKLLLANQVFLASAALGFALLLAANLAREWHVFLFAVITGAGWALNNPLRQALVVNTVPRQSFQNAIALNSLAFNVNRVLGPGLGGLLIALSGPATNFFIQAACYVGVALLVFPIRLGHPETAARHNSSALSDLREGLSYVAKEQTILALMLMGMSQALFIMPFVNGLMPVFSKEVLGLGPDGLGLLLATMGMGGLVAPLTLATMGNTRRTGLVQAGAAMGSGIMLMVFSQSTSLAMALPFLAMLGTCQMFFFVLINIIIQTRIPDALRGRVMSIYSMDIAVAPLGGLVAGTIAQLYGAPLAMLMGGGFSLALILVIVTRFKTVRTNAS
ncbi:MAG: MFS transporter [Chloroflexi bacterium]|nr:MFS transporter [Chloroflexota bacterium]